MQKKTTNWSNLGARKNGAREGDTREERKLWCSWSYLQNVLPRAWLWLVLLFTAGYYWLMAISTRRVNFYFFLNKLMLMFSLHAICGNSTMINDSPTPDAPLMAITLPWDTCTKAGGMMARNAWNWLSYESRARIALCLQDARPPWPTLALVLTLTES